MAYESVDKLQKILAEQVFGHTKDAKKAAGRALGTLVEIITFYVLKSWGYERAIAIERPLPEYGNPEISHNVEFSLHPVLREDRLALPDKLPLTPVRILDALNQKEFPVAAFRKSGNVLLSKEHVLRNACVIGASPASSLVATLAINRDRTFEIVLVEQYTRPYAMFECKRVGIEEGNKKGPQTIEKAKQGAYVARTVSSLHKVRMASGELHGLIFRSNTAIHTKPYDELLAEIITSDDPTLLKDFILTVGVVSNHGNWFTSDNHNKELKVLAQSYDWLIFLTDEGLTEFIMELLLDPEPLLQPARRAFIESYTETSRKNKFTKVQMDYESDQVLQAYFGNNKQQIARWFNVIGPKSGTIEQLRSQIELLSHKDWQEVYAL